MSDSNRVPVQCTQPEVHDEHVWTNPPPAYWCPGRDTRALPDGQHYDAEQVVWSHCGREFAHDPHRYATGSLLAAGTSQWWCLGVVLPDTPPESELLTAIASAAPQEGQRIFGRPGRFAGSRPLMYLSAAISGTDDHHARFTALATLADNLGFEPLSPLDIPPWEHEGDCPVGRNGGAKGDAPHTDACYMRGDIYHMLECDAVLLDSTWRRSWGARAELQAAVVCGLPIYAVVDHGSSREVVQL